MGDHIINKMKKNKPGARFNAFQKKKKAYSESDMGSMKGYDPNLGLGKKGYVKATSVKATPKAPFKLTTKSAVGGVGKFGGVGGLQGGYGAGKAGHQNVGSTEYKKKHSKKKKGSMKHCKNCTC